MTFGFPSLKILADGQIYFNINGSYLCNYFLSYVRVKSSFYLRNMKNENYVIISKHLKESKIYKILQKCDIDKI